MRRLALVAVVLLGFVTSCADDSSETDPESTTPGVSINLLQGRAAYGSREIKLQVVNDSERLLEVDRATYDSSRFTEPAIWDDGTRIPAGFTVDLTVTLPDARCTPGPADDETVTLEVRDDDGGTVRETYRPKELYGSVQKLVDADCARRDVEAVADVRLADHVDVEGQGRDSVARLPLLIDPTGSDGSFTLESIEATYLIGPPSQRETWPLDLTVHGEDAPTRVVLPVIPARCDPHVLADNSQGTEMTALFDVGGRETEFTLGTSAQLKGELTSFVATHCGMGQAPG